MQNFFRGSQNQQLIFIVLLLFILSSCDKNSTDDPVVLPIFSINSNTIDEGNDGTSELSFTIKINTVSDQELSVRYATRSATAFEDVDFVTKNGIATIPVGQTETEIFIQIIGDDNLENDEQFEVVLSNAINADISASNGIGVGTIKNDDAATPINDVGYSTPISYPNLSLVWSDEFTGDVLNTSDWTYETGNSGWGNNELQNYVSGTSNAKVSNGFLTIEAKQSGNSYSSARIITKDKQSFKYGRIDIRARLPEGQGLWPALWMLGQNFSTTGWPSCGEIDIMELVGHAPNKVHGTVHWEHQGNHADFGGSKTLSSGIFADEFHVFTIKWDSQSITWYLDDVQFHVIDITGPELTEFHQEFFFIFNVAVGGNWPGNPNASTNFPQKMVVDYVRVFQ